MRPPELPSRVLLERVIGSGGFATVWLGWDPNLDSPVAVKILAENWAHRADVRHRFLDEGRLLRRVASPRVVSIYDIGELDDGRPYLVMPYLEGGTLAEVRGAGPLPAVQARRLLREIGDGLQALHTAGIVHRDLNPGNVLLGEQGAVLADLGLAKDLAAGSGLTQPMGTGRYRAPEQMTYSPNIGPAADVFAFAVVAEELLNPNDLDRGATRALAAAKFTNPARRPSLAEVLAALEAPRRRARRLLAGALATVAALGLGFTGYAWATRPQQIWDARHRVAVTVPNDWTAKAVTTSGGSGVDATAPGGRENLSVLTGVQAEGAGGASHSDCQQVSQSVTKLSESGKPLTGRAEIWTCPKDVAYQSILLSASSGRDVVRVEKKSVGQRVSPVETLTQVAIR